MSIIDNITRYIYTFSFVEFTVFVLFFVWLYLKIKSCILKKSEAFWLALNGLAFILLLFVVFYKVILSRKAGSVFAEFNLMPFSSYIRYFKGEYPEAFFAGRANILLFMPFGVLLYDFLKTRRNLITFILIAFLFSALLESIQYGWSLGTAEADDIIHNTLGAFLGYLVCGFVSRLEIKIKK